MKVTARYYGFFSNVTSRLSEDLEVAEGSTIKALISFLGGRYGYKFERLCFIRPLYSDRDYANLCINTLDVNSAKKFPSGLETSLKEGDVISFGVVGGAA